MSSPIATRQNFAFELMHHESTYYRWWFQMFCIFTRTWGNDPILTCACFSNGLVQPPTSVQFQLSDPSFFNQKVMVNLSKNHLSKVEWSFTHGGGVFPVFRTVQLPNFQERLEGYDSRYRGESGAVKVAENFPPMEEVDDFLRPKMSAKTSGWKGLGMGFGGCRSEQKKNR